MPVYNLFKKNEVALKELNNIKTNPEIKKMGNALLKYGKNSL
jgi:hypothetical protein